MARQQLPITLGIGDPMPHITLPLASGVLFDSWDAATSGRARVYWLGVLTVAVAAQLTDTLMAWEALLHVVVAALPEAQEGYTSWLIDRMGELPRVFGATGPLAIVVDAAGRVAALVPEPTPDRVAAEASRLHRKSMPIVVQAQAPVLLLERVIEPALCQSLIDYWQHGDKRANEVGSDGSNVADGDVKRRQDVDLSEAGLFVQVRDCLVRRVAPAILQAFHTPIAVIEGPRIGCYDASAGGWFRRHRDNTSRTTAHRQFALSLNLNADDEYDGGEVRFPEYGRELYRPPAGAALVFSSSLLHEVIPVIRGRRFGLFTFLSATAPAARRGP